MICTVVSLRSLATRFLLALSCVLCGVLTLVPATPARAAEMPSASPHLYLRVGAGTGYSAQHWNYDNPRSTGAVPAVLEAYVGAVLGNRFAVGGVGILEPQFGVSGTVANTHEHLSTTFMPWAVFGVFGAWLPSPTFTTDLALCVGGGGTNGLEGGIGVESAASVMWKFFRGETWALGLFGRGGLGLLIDPNVGAPGTHTFINVGIAIEQS